MPTFAKIGLDALLTPENCVFLLIDHAGATGSVLLWEAQLLDAHKSTPCRAS